MLERLKGVFRDAVGVAALKSGVMTPERHSQSFQGNLSYEAIDAKSGEVISRGENHNTLMDSFNWALLAGLFTQRFAFSFGNLRAFPSLINGIYFGISEGTTAPLVTDKELAEEGLSEGAYYTQSGITIGSISPNDRLASMTGIRMNVSLPEASGNPAAGDRTYREAGVFFRSGAQPNAMDVATQPAGNQILVARALFASPYPVKNASTRLNFQWDFTIA